MPCKKVRTSKYLTRKSPTCPGATKKSNDQAEKEVYLDAIYTLAPDWINETLHYDPPPGWWFLDRWPDRDKMTDMFIGEKSVRPKMRTYLNIYFTELKKRGVVLRYAIRNSYPKP
jgi:hypothetical protein